MKLDILKIDAFASQVFSGNPAAVIGLPAWLPDRVLQAIAEENNLSETAYYVRKSDDRFDLRWFTPSVEVDLCGHATLASAFAIFAVQPNSTRLHFETRSGELVVTRAAEGLAMDFPGRMPRRVSTPEGLLAALGLDAGEVWEADDYIVLVDAEDGVEALDPDFQALAAFPKRGIAVTAEGRDFDFVSRWFGPRVGVNEDPVTGSAHTWLAPLWAERLGKSLLTARQGGRRKGNLTCEMVGDRVILTGKAVTFLRGVIEIAG